MSTRSTIAAVLPDGKIKSIYCHFDGYIEEPGVGSILLKHYTDPAKIAALLALGDLSSLEPSIEKPDGHSFDKKVDGYTVAYGRDRGEKDVDGVTYADKAALIAAHNDTGLEFIYLHDGKAWTVAEINDGSNVGKFKPLAVKKPRATPASRTRSAAK